MNVKTKYTKLNMSHVPMILQMILNVCLVGIAAVLSALLIYETWTIFSLFFLNTDSDVSYYQFTDELLVFFLYFEFLALIIKYFEAHFHFPLRYFIYIGITAIIRLIIVDHDDAMHTFWWSLAIIALTGALFLSNARKSHGDH
ncbi:phosphate-starvation-inducible protein PsiE [Paenibacillus sp. WLX1005]|uniref:phosphate-starvation-inducible protein PsiE n=1 Tax=Paenibacillus sp. WLX1005 TaxID=3243766 RepID=UPI00398460A0